MYKASYRILPNQKHDIPFILNPLRTMENMPESSTHMETAIRKQPSAIYNTLTEETADFRNAASSIRRARRLFLVGTGSSFHSAVYGSYFMKEYSSQRFIFLRTSYEFAVYGEPLNRDDVVIVISHRGYKRYSYLSLKKARSAGCVTIAITGKGTSIKPNEADFIFSTVDQEKSSAHTISLMTSMSVLLALAIYSSGSSDSEVSGKLKSMAKMLREGVQASINLSFKDSGKFLDTFDTNGILWLAGFGVNSVTAEEGALKFQETSYIHAFGYETEQLIHGPVRSSDLSSDTFIMIADGSSKERTHEFARSISEVGGRVLTILPSDVEQCTFPYNNEGVGETLSCYMTLPILQVLALNLSLKMGKNPDGFRSEDQKFRKIDEMLGL